MIRIQNYYSELRYLLIKLYWNYKSKNSKTYGVILMFHHITDESVETFDTCKCKVSIFKQILENMQSDGFLFVSIESALDIINNKSNIKFAVVTFDDVPYSMYSNAYPILQALQIPFTLFITTSYLDKDGYLSKLNLKTIASNNLCTIGAHTVSHPVLNKLKNSREEMENSKKELENIIGKKIEFLAYPYGRRNTVSRKNMEQAKSIGFRCAFGAVQAPISDYTSRFLFYLPRIVKNNL